MNKIVLICTGGQVKWDDILTLVLTYKPDRNKSGNLNLFLH